MAKINKRKRAGVLKRKHNRAVKMKKLFARYELVKSADKEAILAKVAKLAPQRLAEFKK